MSMEQMGGAGAMNNNERTDTTNQMQMALASGHGEDLVDFVEKHAEDFRRVVDEDPSILVRFKEDPEGTLRSIDGKIYH